MKKINFKLVASIAAIVLIGALIACANNEQKELPERKINIKTAEVKSESLSIPISTSGKLASKSETKLSFKTGGIVAKIFVAEGQLVKKGEIIAKLDLVEIDSKVEQAAEGYKKAERDYKRVEKLYADSVVTLEQLQNAETAMEVAQSNLDIAEFNKKHSEIYAPSKGRILKKLAENNELVGPGNPIVMFGSTESGWLIKTGLSDVDIVKLKIGDEAKVTFDAYPEKEYSAVITEIGGAASPMTGTFEIELKLVESENSFSSGFFANLQIYPSSLSTFKVIPIEAIFEADGSDAVVFTVDKNNLAKKKNIKIARILSDKVAVSSGLDNVNIVVTDGVEYLASGSKVDIIN